MEEKRKKLSECPRKRHIIFDISYAVPVIDFFGENDKIVTETGERAWARDAVSVNFVFDIRRE